VNVTPRRFASDFGCEAAVGNENSNAFVRAENTDQFASLIDSGRIPFVLICTLIRAERVAIRDNINAPVRTCRAQLLKLVRVLGVDVILNR